MGIEFTPERALAGNRGRRVISMNGERTGLGHTPLGGGQRVSIGAGHDIDFCAEGFDASNLGSTRQCRHENLSLVAKTLRSKCHGGAVIAARGCDDAGSGYRHRQERIESAARLERAAMLQQFQLQRQLCVRSERSQFKRQDRRAADMAVEAPRRGLNIVGSNHDPCPENQRG